ncbi:MAG: hypothetical protein J6W84_06430 [Bacteroidales bacterium]|nr:hypothetical protein [Bacteroidales bacterium]
MKMNLRQLSLEEFAAEFITKTQAIEEFYKLCHGVNAGKTISLLFNPHRLSTDTEKDDLSIYESLQDDNKIDGLARLYLYNMEHKVANSFYNTIQRGFQNVQYVNEFPPAVARDIYIQYGNKPFLKILDPCAGWGGRMIGAASIPNTYYEACEPNTKTYEGLLNLGAWLKQLQPTFDFCIHKIPYEEFTSERKFDIALTSPPYYNTEHYSDEETNSLNRYKTFDSWVDGFYTPLILKTVDRLDDGGVFILNVGDRKYPLSDRLFEISKSNDLYCSRIKDYLSGNGEGKEKFYCVSKEQKIIKKTSLF